MPSIKDYGVKMDSPNWGVFTPAGQTLTTAQKQAQNPYYNPLYDPHSAEYKAHLLEVSNPQKAKPKASPVVTNPIATPQTLAPKSLTVPNANPLLGGNQGSPVPQFQTPKQGPNQPLITLPPQFQKPTLGPPQNPAIPNGIQMPNRSAFQPARSFGRNWNDFLTVAYNRNQR